MVTTQYTVEQLTEVSDALLKSISVHIKKEFEMGRITGTDYSQVYIAGIQSSLAQAQQFLLSKDAQGYQVDLLAIQKEVATRTKEAQVDTAFATSQKAQEEAKMLLERHGMNYLPELLQGMDLTC